MPKSTSLFEIGAPQNASSQPLQRHTLHEAFDEKMIKHQDSGEVRDRHPGHRHLMPGGRSWTILPIMDIEQQINVGIKVGICNNFSGQHSKLPTECEEITVLMLKSWSKAPVLAVKAPTLLLRPPSQDC